MLLPLERNQEAQAGNMSNSKLQVTLLADEWKSSKGGLSTINRELAIQLAKHPNVSVTFLVPECTEDDKNASSACNVRIVKAQEHYAFYPVDLLSFPPDDLSIDIIIGHGVKLGKHAQIIKKSHQCKWVQVVHTAPEELSMLKTYSDCDNAIAKGDEKQWNEIKLCERADLVVTIGPRLWESYSRYLSSSGKHVFNLTPGIFSELSSLKLSIVEGKRFNVLLFGRGDSEDFELKGFDIAAKAVAQLNDTSYQLVFVGAPSGNEKQVAEKLLKYGLRKNQLIVKPFLENRKDLATLLSTADLAIIPSRSEGFGLTALEVLSAGRPFLVTQTSGFGEALQDALPQSITWIVDSEEPEKWAEAIKSVREKGREAAIAECQTLRKSYGKKYIWESQCRDLVEKMVSLANASGSKLSLSARSPLPEDQRLTEERLEDKREERREGFTAHDFETTGGRKSSYFCSQGTTPEKNLSSSLERPKASGSKMKSSVTAASSQSLNEASIVISEIEEKQSVASSKSEQCQKLQENRPEHFVGVNEGGNVINVIGGDDNSKEDGKEDQDFISRWAMGYVSSQFSEGISQSINRVHLFNCDNTYNLEPVEHLLNKIAELDGHHMCVVKHSFKLAKMSEIVDKISTLMMDMAVFVVHAHESWPSSNEDNRGIGFTKIYRALLQATGGDVIIVIGGDNKYKGEDEEEREVISRWAKRKVSSQFGEECLDGRKSFIFSWNKQHRVIHEQALRHHFDPDKKGQKFHYQRQFPHQESKSGPELRATLTELGISQGPKTQKSPTCTLKSSSRRDEATSAIEAVKGRQTGTYGIGVNSTECGGRHRRLVEPSLNNQSNCAGETLPSVSGGIKDLAILGCNVSRESLEDAKKVFNKLRPSLHFSEEPFVGNLQSTKVEVFLRDNHFIFSVLVTDGSTTSDSYDKQRWLECQRLVENMKDKVALRVILLICYRNPSNSSVKGDSTYNDFIARISRREKTFVVEVNNGELAVDEDIMVELLTPPVTASITNKQMVRSRGSLEMEANAAHTSREVSLKRYSSGRKSIHEKVAQNPPQLVWASQFSVKSPPVVLVRGVARYGKIPDRYQIGDLQIWDPKFNIPAHIQEKLLENLCNTPLIGVLVIKHSDGEIECFTDPKLKEFSLDGEIQLAADEQLILKTRVCNGEVSFEEAAVQFKYGNKCIPQHIINGFKAPYRKPNGDLYIISDNSDNFRCVVKSPNKFEKVARMAKEDFQPLSTNKWYRIV